MYCSPPPHHSAQPQRLGAGLEAASLTRAERNPGGRSNGDYDDDDDDDDDDDGDDDDDDDEVTKDEEDVDNSAANTDHFQHTKYNHSD